MIRCSGIKYPSISTPVRLFSPLPSLPFLFDFITDAAVLLLGFQMTQILRFFLARNMRIARDRAWDQTVASRGKGPDFWRPYVEEWEHPPVVKRSEFVKRWFGGWFGLFMIKRGMFGFVLC